MRYVGTKTSIVSITVVVPCVCVYVCPLISAASYIGITKERFHWIHHNTGIIADFSKNALFKSYGLVCLPQAAPES